MDVMLTLFTYLALYAYLRLYNENQKWWFVVWSSCALALMIKGAGGIIAPAAIVLALAFDKRFSAAIRSRYFWQGVLLACLIIAPWHILMYVRYGRPFIDEYIGYHVIAAHKDAGRTCFWLFLLSWKVVDGSSPGVC